MNEHRDGTFLRIAIGLISLAAAVTGFFLLFYIEIPARNENALLLALGVVLGWGGSVVSSEYGATTTGRKVAESAIRKIERQDESSNEEPKGTDKDPMKAEIINTEESPANVKEAKK